MQDAPPTDRSSAGMLHNRWVRVVPVATIVCVFPGIARLLRMTAVAWVSSNATKAYTLAN